MNKRSTDELVHSEDDIDGGDQEDEGHHDLNKTHPISNFGKKKSSEEHKGRAWSSWKNKPEKDKEKKKKEEKKDKEKGRKTIKLAEVKEMNKEQKTHLDTFLLSYSLQKLPGTTWRYYHLNQTVKEENTSDLLASPSLPSPVKIDAINSIHSTSSPSIPIPSGLNTTKKSLTISHSSFHSPETLFLLPCGTARPEAYFDLMLNLSEKFQVIAPSFPVELNEFDDYVAGLVLIMRHIKVKKIHLYGTSFSASVAHYFLYKYPEKVHSVVLSHLVLPNDSCVRQCERFLKKIEEKRSMFLVRSLAGFGVKREDLMLEVSNIKYEEVEFWYHLFKNFGASKQAVSCMCEALIDYHDNKGYTNQDFDFNIPILIIDSRKSLQSISEFDYLSEIQSLFSKNKCVQYHVFEGEGQLFSVVRVKEIVGILKNFWSQYENTTHHGHSHTHGHSSNQVTPQNKLDTKEGKELRKHPKTTTSSSPSVVQQTIGNTTTHHAPVHEKKEDHLEERRDSLTNTFSEGSETDSVSSSSVK